MKVEYGTIRVVDFAANPKLTKEHELKKEESIDFHLSKHPVRPHEFLLTVSYFLIGRVSGTAAVAFQTQQLVLITHKSGITRREIHKELEKIFIETHQSFANAYAEQMHSILEGENRVPGGIIEDEAINKLIDILETPEGSINTRLN